MRSFITTRWFSVRSLANGLALVWAAGTLLTGIAQGAEKIPAERRLPRDVVAYVSFRNVSDFRTQWSQSRESKLLNDESLSDFRLAAMEKLTQLSAIVAEHVGLGISDLAEIPYGELAASLAVLPDGKLAGALLLDYGDKEEAVHKLLEKLSERSREEGLEHSEEEFEDTKLTIYRKPAATGGPQVMDAVAYFQKDSLLVVGNTPQTLKSILTRWDGQHDGVLAENPVFRYVTDACRESGSEELPLVNWYVDPLGIFRAVLAANTQNVGQGAMILAVLPALGLDKFKGIGGSFDLVEGDFDMVSRALVYMEPPVRGVLNLFQFVPGDQAPPRWVTADAQSYFTIHWSVDKAYAAAESLMDTFQGPGATARLVQQLADSDELGNLHIKKDLIDVLTGKVHVVGAPETDDGDENFLVAAEVKNAGSAKATLRKLAQLQSVQVKEREFQGETLYEIAAVEEDDDDGEATPMGIVVAENHLMFSSSVKLLEQVLRGTEGRDLLADAADYKRISRRFPETVVGSSYARESDPLASLRALLASPGFIQLQLLHEGDDVHSLEEKLPPPETLRKFAVPSGSYIQPDEKGLKIVSFTLKLPE